MLQSREAYADVSVTKRVQRARDECQMWTTKEQTGTLLHSQKIKAFYSESLEKSKAIFQLWNAKPVLCVAW